MPLAAPSDAEIRGKVQPETPSELTEADLDRVVRAFYGRVRQDPLLGPVFDGAIDDWEHHLVKLQAFWSSVMLWTGRYKGQPMAVHIGQAAHMTPEAFQRWLSLWDATASELLEPAAAAALQEKARRIAESLSLGVAFHKDRGIAR
jgi:hemoglobin